MVHVTEEAVSDMVHRTRIPIFGNNIGKRHSFLGKS